MTRSIRCPHCGSPHDAGTTVCPITLRAIAPSSSVPTARPSEPTKTPASSKKGGSRRELLGQTIDGKFRVRAILGEGGMGTVFEAEHVAIGRIVAMKVLHPAQASKSVAVKRFHQEARAAGGIGHPNICEVYDIGTLPDGSPYLVMERLTGETLAARVTAEGGLPFDEVIDIATDVLAALAAAHERGILHRDIKPENVFLTRRGGMPSGVKLLDFGVSKITANVASEWDDETDLTKTGMVMGTPYYMSPEQARGERNLDGRVDIYATGVLLFEALTARRPFLANNYNSLLLQILSAAPQPPIELRPSIPKPLNDVILRAMAKKRDDRFPSAQDMSRALQACRIDRGAKTGPRPAARPAAKSSVDPLAHSAVDIPITFSDDDVELEQTTSPLMGLPKVAPSEQGSPYDDGDSDETIKLDSREKKRPSIANMDDATERMQSHEVESIAQALREARERERAKTGNKKGGG
jgi:serine/threonine-protein kinase